MKIFYFTATGNSLYVSKKIGGELYSIPQMMKDEKYEFEDEAIGFVFPCHGFGVARLTRDFIKKSSFRAEYFFAIMTYGSNPASGLKQIEQAGSKAGIRFNYTNEILMVDNYLPNFMIEDEVKLESSKRIKENLDQIIQDIANRENKFTRKDTVSDVMSEQGRQYADKLSYNYSHEQFDIWDNCNRCKICEKVCPVDNVRVDKKPVFSNQCEMCFACIHLCPQNAIHMESEQSGKRFLNQHIELNEIILANNQHSVPK